MDDLFEKVLTTIAMIILTCASIVGVAGTYIVVAKI